VRTSLLFPLQFADVEFDVFKALVLSRLTPRSLCDASFAYGCLCACHPSAEFFRCLFYPLYFPNFPLCLLLFFFFRGGISRCQGSLATFVATFSCYSLKGSVSDRCRGVARRRGQVTVTIPQGRRAVSEIHDHLVAVSFYCNYNLGPFFFHLGPLSQERASYSIMSIDKIPAFVSTPWFYASVFPATFA